MPEVNGILPELVEFEILPELVEIFGDGSDDCFSVCTEEGAGGGGRAGGGFFFYPLEALWFLPAKCGMESFRSFETNSLWVVQPQKD